MSYHIIDAIAVEVAGGDIYAARQKIDRWIGPGCSGVEFPDGPSDLITARQLHHALLEAGRCYLTGLYLFQFEVAVVIPHLCIAGGGKKHGQD